MIYLVYNTIYLIQVSLNLKNAFKTIIAGPGSGQYRASVTTHIEQIGGDRESQLHHAFVLNEDDS